MRAIALLLSTVVLGFAAASSNAAVVNLAESANGFGILPVIGLDQGTASGIADGNLFSWFGPVTSPRNFTATNIQPYMTWSSAQDVRIVRAWRDAGGDWDRLMIDTLTPGGNPTVEGDWINRYDSGTGLIPPAARFQDINLGATYSSQGVRARGFSLGADVDVGEVAVFGPQDFAGNLTALKLTPTGTAASSTEHRPQPLAVNGDWYDNGWLSGSQAANADPDFTFDLTFNAATLDGASLTWSQQGGFSVLPDQWELLADFGAGFVSLGTFAKELAQNGSFRSQYYYDFGLMTGVDAIRVRIAESDVPSAGRVGLVEFEAFRTQAFPAAQVPEPAAWTLLGLGALGLTGKSRRTRRS